MFVVGLSYMAFVMLRQISPLAILCFFFVCLFVLFCFVFCFHRLLKFVKRLLHLLRWSFFLNVSICYNGVSCWWFANIEDIPCLTGINPTWSWHVNFKCIIGLCLLIFLRIFLFMFISDIRLILFLSFFVSWFWYLGIMALYNVTESVPPSSHTLVK